MAKSWKNELASSWNAVLKKQRVVKVKPTTWPCACKECDGDGPQGLERAGEQGGALGACWKCNGTGEESREPAVIIVFSNGAELIVRSQFAAALFMKKPD